MWKFWGSVELGAGVVQDLGSELCSSFVLESV